MATDVDIVKSTASIGLVDVSISVDSSPLEIYQFVTESYHCSLSIQTLQVHHPSGSPCLVVVDCTFIPSNHRHLVIDSTLVIFNVEGRRSLCNGLSDCSMVCSQHKYSMPALQNGTPLAIPQHLKKMRPEVVCNSDSGLPLIHNTNNPRHPSRSSLN